MDLRKIFIICTLLLTAMSCRKDASEMYVTATLSSSMVKSGDSMFVTVEARSLSSTLDKVSVSTFDSVRGNVDCLDVNPGKPKYSNRVVFDAPLVTENSTMRIFVSASDLLGESFTIERIVDVTAPAPKPDSDPQK